MLPTLYLYVYFKKTGSNTLKLFFKVLKPAFIYNLEAICPAAYTPLAKG